MSAKYIYTVYKTTNNVNGKIYIGVHKTTNPNDSYLGSGIALQKAFGKHGKENFSKEILFEFNTKEKAYEKEIELVNENFINSKNTYNIGKGGCGGFEKKHIYSGKGKYKTNLADFIKKSNSIHKNKFDYSLITKWEGIKKKVSIICPLHGEFKQVAESHKNGCGCDKCGRIQASKSLKNIRKNKYWKSR